MKKKKCKSEPTPKDLLSSLSDELLHAILFHLPAKDVAATCILSRRWLHVWASTPDLDITDQEFILEIPEDDDDVPYQRSRDAFIKFVDRALLHRRHNAALRSLCVSVECNTGGAVNSRARYAVDHGAQVLEFGISEDFSLPVCGPNFNDLHCLQKLKIDTEYDRVFNWPDSIRLPSLTHLHLGACTFSPTVGKDFVSKSCPRLQILILSQCYGLVVLELVNHPLLEEVEVRSLYELEELFVQCTNLRSLDVSGCFFYCNRRSIYLDAPYLKKFKLNVRPLFSCLCAESSTFPSLEFASFDMDGMDYLTAEDLALDIEKSVDIMGSLLMRLANVKQLCINSPWNLVGLSFYLQNNMNKYANDFVFVNIEYINIIYSPQIVLDAFYFLIMSSPNLKTLTITNNEGFNRAKIEFDMPKVEIGELCRRKPSSLGNLTKVKFKNFGGTKCEMDLLKLLLSSANALSKMIIQFPKRI